MDKKRMIPGSDGFRCVCGATFTTSESAMGHILVHALVGDDMEYRDIINMLYNTHCCIVNDEACYTTKDKRSMALNITQNEITILIDGILTRNKR